MKQKTVVIILLFLCILITSCQEALNPDPTTPHPSRSTAKRTPIPTLPTTPIPSPTSTPEPLPELSFLTQPEGTIRLMSFNVNWDSIFPDDDPLNDPFREYDRSDAYTRVLQAIKPQVLCLQEINPIRNPQKVADLLDEIIPLEDWRRWQTHKGGDNIIAAAFDLHLTGTAIVINNPITGRGHATALVDLPDDAYPLDLYLVCAHFKSQGGQSNIDARQIHADAITAWIRDIQTPGGEIDLPFGTPFSIIGDLNVYDTDPAHHLVTLLTGDILDEDKHGPDITPDWDNTPLGDALPHHNGDGTDTYTWRDDTQEFNPGVLDRVLYTDSVIVLENGFVLNTMTLSADFLAAAGLLAEDIMLDTAVGDYDHLPLVVDISFTILTSRP